MYGLDVMVHACNPSTPEAGEEGGLQVKANLGYTVRSYLKNNQTNEQTNNK
jgi:hypothetical protein